MNGEFSNGRSSPERPRRTDTELPFGPEDVEAFWSKVASGRYEEANVRVRATHVQRFAVSVPRLDVPPGGRLLNVWSRQGEAIPYIRARFPSIEIENAEISRVMLAQATERFPREKFVWTDLQTLDYTDGHFDSVLSLEMLEHSPSPRRILREIHRVLKQGGQLVLTCPAAAVEVHLWIADRLLGNHGEGPHRFPSTRLVKSMLGEAGFTLVSHRATLFVPEELGALRKINPLLERTLQWFPASELGLRQLYEARK